MSELQPSLSMILERSQTGSAEADIGVDLQPKKLAGRPVTTWEDIQEGLSILSFSQLQHWIGKSISLHVLKD
jgi:hypothetical protein